MDLKIKDILKCTNGVLIIGDEDVKCENYSKDTRTINKNDTYIGIKGENFDGSLFWQEAFEKGASTIIINKIDISEKVIDKYRKMGKNIIQVEDTKLALIEMAKLKRKMYGDKLIVIGVTGSVGKTSTKDIIANVLCQKYKTLKTEGNNNNDIGLPFTILKLKDHEAAVIEMGMNHLGEISLLTKIAQPTISVITNIGTAHIGNLGSRENILKAKVEILEGMQNKRIVINNDNDLLSEWAEKNFGKIEIHTFGINKKSECMAQDILYSDNRSTFKCNLKEEKFSIEIPVQGDHFVLNALCATMVGNLCNLSKEEITNGIKNFNLSKKRMEILHFKDNITVINDTYNASFESMKASIDYLGKSNFLRKIAVLGDMFELGNYSEELHRKVGRVVYENNIDILLTVGNYSQFIANEAADVGMNKQNIYFFESKKELENFILDFIRDGDMILFKASNGMRLFEIVEDLSNYFKN